MTTPAQPRSPLFWILLAAGIVVGGCCFMTAGVMALGAFADDPVVSTSSPPSSSGAAGGDWLVAGEVARGNALTIPLAGGRWVAQYGSLVDTVVARAGNTQWVQTNSSGAIYEIIFDDDGSYVWNLVSSVSMSGFKTSSRCTEKGSWSLSGTVLTLTPESQFAAYSNQTSTQEKRDEELSERQYQVLDLTLETLERSGVPAQQFPGLLVSGPKAIWDTRSGDQLNLTMQRLALRE